MYTPIYVRVYLSPIKEFIPTKTKAFFLNGSESYTKRKFTFIYVPEKVFLRKYVLYFFSSGGTHRPEFEKYRVM